MMIYLRSNIKGIIQQMRYERYNTYFPHRNSPDDYKVYLLLVIPFPQYSLFATY